MHLIYNCCSKILLIMLNIRPSKLKEVSGPPAWSIFRVVKTDRQTDNRRETL